MEMNQTDVGEKWDRAEWEERARAAELLRESYRNTLLRPQSPDLDETVQRLVSLLYTTKELAGNPLFFPEMQRDFYLNAVKLLGEVTEIAFPNRRGHLPSAGYVRRMCEEVRELLGPLPAMYRMLRKNASFGLSDTWAAFQKDRGELMELWVKSRMPISATSKQVDSAVTRCRTELKKSYDSEKSKVARIATGELSLKMVAIVLNTSARIVKRKKRQGAPHHD